MGEVWKTLAKELFADYRPHRVWLLDFLPKGEHGKEAIGARFIQVCAKED